MGYPETSAGNYHLNPEDGTVRLSRNVGKKFPLEPRRWDLWLFRNVDKKFPLQPQRWDRWVVPKRRQEISTSTPKMGPIGCLETSTRNFHLNPEGGANSLSRNVDKKFPLNPTGGTDRLSRNVVKKLPLLEA